MGVFETVGIHWVDLFINLFGEIKSYELFNKVGSNIGTAYDTSCAVFTHKDKNIFTSILVSYASCKYFKVICQGTDGVLEIDNNSFKIISPRDVFDEKGHFDYPNFKKNIYDFDKDYEMSLKHSIEFFLESAKSKKVFNKNSFLRGLKTNYFLINTTEKEVYNDDI